MWNEAMRRVLLLAGVLGAVAAFFAAPGALHPYRGWAPPALMLGILAYRAWPRLPAAPSTMRFPAGAYVPADVLGTLLAAVAVAVPLSLVDPPSALFTEPELLGPLSMFGAIVLSAVALVGYGASRAAYRLEVRPSALSEETLTGRREILLGQVDSAVPVEVGPRWPVLLAMAFLGVGIWPLFILAALLRSTRCRGVRLHAPSGAIVVRTDLAGFEAVWKLLAARHLVGACHSGAANVRPNVSPRPMSGDGCWEMEIR